MKSSRERAENYLTVDRISKYKDKDIESLVKILDQHAAEARAEQLQACIEAANEAISELNIRPSQKADVILAVGNATGGSNDQ